MVKLRNSKHNLTIRISYNCFCCFFKFLQVDCWWPAGYRGTPKIFQYTGKILPVASFYSQHSLSAFLVSIRVSICYVIKEDTIARPVCLLKRARVGALSEGNMVEATHVMRKVQPFRVDCTLCQ